MRYARSAALVVLLVAAVPACSNAEAEVCEQATALASRLEAESDGLLSEYEAIERGSDPPMPDTGPDGDAFAMLDWEDKRIALDRRYEARRRPKYLELMRTLDERGIVVEQNSRCFGPKERLDAERAARDARRNIDELTN